MNWSPSTRLLLACIVLLSGSGGTAMTASAANPAVQMSSVTVNPTDPNVGERVTIEATIANLENSDTTVDVRDLYIRTPGTAEEFARLEDVGSIAPGGSMEIPISTTFESAGERRLDVNLVVQDDDGNYHSYTYPVYIEVTEPNVKAQLSTRASDEGSSTTAVSLTNFGNADLTDVEITADVDGETIDRKFVFDVPPKSNQTTVFDTGDVSSETVRFTAEYAAAGENHTTSLTVDLDDQTEIPGEVRLTGIEALRTGGGVTVQGDAANLGGTDAESVLVRVQETDGVTPAPPSSEYFVGAIDASEFATFELTAQTESSASAVQIEISYIVDNERVTTTQEVSLDAASSVAAGPGGMPGGEGGPDDGPNSPGGSGGLPLTAIGIAAALVLVVGFGVYRWRGR
ncbi:hypothetical protein [Halobellus sp. GM3]|uniref:hypothetical protein n=1 Tax=Halobellus sp. GM3 TaxID=3458410 RepID=UPI00403DC13D